MRNTFKFPHAFTFGKQKNYFVCSTSLNELHKHRIFLHAINKKIPLVTTNVEEHSICFSNFEI